jgi:DNA-binding phage protein
VAVIAGSKVKGSRRHTKLYVDPAVSPIVAQLLGVVLKHKVNITHLGRLYGVPHETIYRWAKGRPPRLHDLEAVSQALGMRVLLDRDPGDGGDND